MSISDIIRIPFGYLLEFLYNLTNNYGIALILFALVVKLILLPIGMKSKKSTMKMSRVSPLLKELERKYGDDKTRYQQEVMKVYQEEGISPMGGCLWSFVPLLILLPLYHVIRMPLQYMMHLPAETAEAIVTVMTTDLGLNLGSNNFYSQLVAASLLPEHIEQVRALVPTLAGVELPIINFEFLGVDLSAIPSFKFWTLSGWATIGLFLIPLISGFFNWLSMWISQKQNDSVATDDKGEKQEGAAPAASSMKSMMYIMPVFSIYIGFTMPASISIYWIAQGLLGILQDTILTKHYRKVYDAEDLIRKQRAAEQAAIEAERERIRAERRAQNPDGITENTSKKKLKAREKAERGPVSDEKLTQEERAELKAQREAAASEDPNRPWCKGRAYIADRYGANGEDLTAEPQETELTETEPAAAEPVQEPAAGEDTNE